MPKTADGGVLASMDLSMKLFAEYVELAYKGDIEGLHRALERDTDAEHTHPNQLLLGCALLLRDIWKETGRSPIPMIIDAARRWDDDGRTRPARRFLWGPDGASVIRLS